MSRSGDGWTSCDRGHRHWGRHGAAGLLLRRLSDPSEPDGPLEVALHLRSAWSHHGGSWGIPGGARDAGESVVQAALREAAEEASVDPRTVRPEALFVDDHGGWGYSTVVARGTPQTRVAATSAETDEMRWVRTDRVADLQLHPGFAASWPRLRGIPAAPRVVVDAANVVGSRPDGWWRDRHGAAVRLRDELAAGLTDWPASELPEPWHGAEDLSWWPSVIMVVEGRAKGVDPVPGVEVVDASGSGDDTIVDLVAATSAPSSLVITADRELAARVAHLGAVVVGPRRLFSLLALTDPGRALT